MKNNFLLIAKYDADKINGKLKELKKILKKVNKDGYGCYAYIKDNKNKEYYKIYIYGDSINYIQKKQSDLEIKIGLMEEFLIFDETEKPRKEIIRYKK